MMREIVTSTNNKYYFNIITHEVDKRIKSEEFSSKTKAVMAFVDAMKNTQSEQNFWGQLICHHYADEWQEEKTEVILTLNDRD